MYDETYQSGTIYKVQPSSSGQVEVCSTGCKRIDENIRSTTAASTAIKTYGFNVINCTAPNTLSSPQLGDRVEILFTGTTKAMKLKGGLATFNNSTDDVLSVTLGTTKAKGLGLMVVLKAASTVKWWLGVAPQSSDITITLSSAT